MLKSKSLPILAGAAALGIAVLLASPANVDLVDPEVDLITSPPTANLPPPSGNLNAGTNNPLNVTSFLSSFTLTPPGGILELTNNTGGTLANFDFTLFGTAASADTGGVLTCSVNQTTSGATCTVSANAKTSSTGSGGTVGTLAMPGAPPWTWDFTGANIPSGANFDLQFGSFNAADHLTTVPAPLIGGGLPVLLAVGGILFGAKLLERSKKRRSLGTAVLNAAA
jgi:hypothetical protein